MMMSQEELIDSNEINQSITMQEINAGESNQNKRKMSSINEEDMDDQKRSKRLTSDV